MVSFYAYRVYKGVFLLIVQKYCKITTNMGLVNKYFVIIVMTTLICTYGGIL